MGYNILRYVVCAIVGAAIIVGCGKDLLQIILHPSVDTRFADSVSGNLPVPATPTISGNPNQFNFAVFGDPQLAADGANFINRLTSDIASKGIQFFVVLGDLTEDATKAEFANIKWMLDNTGAQYLTTVGNHDLFEGPGTGGWDTWKSTFGAATYSVTVAGVVRFIFIDTASGDIGGAQFAWLEDQLNREKNVPFTFVCSHYAIYDGITPKIWRLESVEERYRLTSLLSGAGVYGFLAGHLHGFKHASFAKMEHFIIGSMYPRQLDYGKHGYVLFTYDSGKLTWQWIQLD